MEKCKWGSCDEFKGQCRVCLGLLPSKKTWRFLKDSQEIEDFVDLE